MFSQATIREIEGVARELAIEAAALLAVADVESGGSATAMVDGRPEPLIRFEGHYFDRRLVGAAQTLAREAGLSDPTPGAVANPPSQPERWAMLTRAAAIDRKAAWESTSWGIGQVMGAHWAWLGYPNVAALVEEARSGVAGQARLMARYIERAGLSENLRAHDWRGFARGYNGPAFATNGYDRRLRAAYMRHRDPASTGEAADLRRGMSCDAVAELQEKLNRLGQALARDGLFGARTELEVSAFQRQHGLLPDGVFGPLTRAALEKALAAKAGFWSRILDWLRILLRLGG